MCALRSGAPRATFAGRVGLAHPLTTSLHSGSQSVPSSSAWLTLGANDWISERTNLKHSFFGPHSTNLFFVFVVQHPSWRFWTSSTKLKKQTLHKAVKISAGVDWALVLWPSANWFRASLRIHLGWVSVVVELNSAAGGRVATLIWPRRVLCH